MDSSSGDADRLRGEADERRLERWFPSACRPTISEDAARERLGDQLGAQTLAGYHRRAKAVQGREDCEPARRALRALGDPYLDLVSREIDLEIDRLRAGFARPETSIETELALCREASQRRELFGEWLATEERERELSAVREEIRADAARAAGASSLYDFRGTACAVSPSEWSEQVGRHAIAPLDDLVDAAARSRWNRFGLERESAHDSSAFLAISPFVDRLTRSQIVAIVRRVGSSFGEDPDSGGPRIAIGAGGRPWCESGLTRGGEALLVPGDVGGPAGLWDLLGGYGSSSRAGRLARMRGTAAVRFCDPAFAAAAHTLWRRLVLCPVFRGEIGLEAHGADAQELAFHDAVAMRLAWAYLHSVDVGIGPDSAEFSRTVQRASGARPTPTHRNGTKDGDAGSASVLRGSVLGLLLEERLRVRFGRRWYGRSEARRWLLEVWEAEPDMTAEEMARSLDLGTIEPTPMVDASRGVVVG